MKFLENITPRDYQKNILESCKKENCLVVLPTGLGKTLIALMLSVHRMQEHPGEKVVFLAPTKPLAEQHLDYFKKNLPELFGDMQLFTGAVNAEKRKKIWQTADIIFSTPQCVDGKTMIFTREGPIEIKEFFKKFKFQNKRGYEICKINEEVLGYDGKKTSFLKATKAIKIPQRELVEIKTELGNSINCTKDHPLLTISPEGDLSWKESSKLKKGDYIASINQMKFPSKKIEILDIISKNNSLKIANKELTRKLIKKLRENKIKTSEYSRYYQNFMPLKSFLELSKKTNFDFGELNLTDHYGKSSFMKLPKELDFKLGYIVGAFLGDGHLGNRTEHGSEVVFSDLDRESVNEEIKKTINKVFGIKMKENKKGLITYNSAFSSFLNSMGIPKGNKSKKIQIPKYFFFSEEDAIKGFIKGIFDTDGSASEDNVSISSASEKFIKELKWLFLKVGIIGNTEKRKTKKSIIRKREIKESEIFTFRFSGRKNLLKFLEVDPNKDKCKKLIEKLKNTKNPGTRSKDILPIPKLMKKIQENNKGKEEHYKFFCFSKENLKQISKKFKDEESKKLRDLLELPIRWVKIKEKKTIPEKKEVYDLTIEKHHNFIANSLVNHNCVANDLKKNLYNLDEVCLLIEDEAHRCIKNYDYNFIAQKYKSQSQNPRIVGLTASPGSESSKIKEICRNLSIKNVELRTRNSSDVKEYLQEREFEKIMVDFPPEFQEMKHILQKLINNYVEELKSRKVLFGPANKTQLIQLQKKISGTLARNPGSGNFNYMLGASACAQAIKLHHAMDLLETQTLEGFNNYLKEIFKQASKKQSKGVVKLAAKQEFNFLYMQSSELLSKNQEHPKLQKLSEIIENEFEEHSKTKSNSSETPRIIIFTQFRETAKKVSENLNKIKNVKAESFVGQAVKNGTGLSQKKQKEVIEKFKESEINVLVATSIAEEGLDIPEVNAVIFYEPIPSAIRSIQRAGRTARLSKGKLIMLITKNTKDESFFYVSRAREKKMETSIEQIKKDLSSGMNFDKEEKQSKL